MSNISQITPQAAQQIADTVRAVNQLPANGATTPLPYNSVSNGGGLPKWGTLVSLWAGGDTVELTPCGGPADSTPTGDENVTVYCEIPLTGHTQYCGANVGDILAYWKWGSTMVLVRNPLPMMSGQYQGWYNNSTTSPNVVADFLKVAG